MAMDAADLTVTVSPDAALLTLSGEVDVNTVPGWQEMATEALQHKPSTVVVDLSAVTFMDSSGLGVLAVLVRATRGTGATLYAVRPCPVVRRVITVCGLDGYFTFVDEADARLAELTGSTDLTGEPEQATR